ncbi:aminoacetone oxidase family FAD-binding enzyme [Oceanobacillus sp. 143]|uniref:Aminoacetone oxidase family FAD-binding enzyme n=1 Tax=Oceanobacillus zhaokaii TaxID=2052660 RepID=A0A345PFS1_9BACI|nr:NAD(P)/FAD-dependent oxidoreductase [Oceanobacillus zhaokaii]AXI08851.1 aminoacetone oxidase family FAD-binding enzyme [Oceanobacillus zhaokaii]QGS68536.1 aminoacetone oxidase family FAD-binding enzyme [Oceanobacillus sp. 143]
MTYDVTVIGGGPSGLMAAIGAAEKGAKTLLLEKGNKLGKKLAISGGGRCNVTNRLPQEEVIKHIPGNGKFLYSAFSVFNNYDIIDYFENMGVGLKEEDHGRMFPVSNSAKTVVNALINKLDELQVKVQQNTPVEAIHYSDKAHTVILKDGKHIDTKALVIAVGGKAVPYTGSTGDGYAWAKKAGHTVTELYPTEVALTSDEAFIQEKSLQGLALRDAAVSVLNKRNKPIITHQMDMLFTHFGVSGPAVLRCSQFVVKELMKGQTKVPMVIDALPAENEEKLAQDILKSIEENPKKTFKNLMKGIIPERFLAFILEQNNVTDEQKGGNISKETVRSIIHTIKNFTFYVNGSLPMEKAFVTGGGVSIKEIVPNTMQSKIMNGLYFCGEILDIHGYTGGYNITSALVTGRLAGTNAAEESATIGK